MPQQHVIIGVCVTCTLWKKLKNIITCVLILCLLDCLWILVVINIPYW